MTTSQVGKDRIDEAAMKCLMSLIGNPESPELEHLPEFVLLRRRQAEKIAALVRREVDQAVAKEREGRLSDADILLIDSVYMPRNPNKVRSAAPEVVALIDKIKRIAAAIRARGQGGK